MTYRQNLPATHRRRDSPHCENADARQAGLRPHRGDQLDPADRLEGRLHRLR